MKNSRNFIQIIIVCALSFVLIFTNLPKDVNKMKLKEESCGRFPRQENIFTDNVIWQVLETSFGFVYLLNSYLDARWNQSIVRVNIIARPLNVTAQKFFCQFWFDENSQPFVVEASEIQKMWFNGEM
jgi:hypothetical protein